MHYDYFDCCSPFAMKRPPIHHRFCTHFHTVSPVFTFPFPVFQEFFDAVRQWIQNSPFPRENDSGIFLLFPQKIRAHALCRKVFPGKREEQKTDDDLSLAASLKDACARTCSGLIDGIYDPLLFLIRLGSKGVIVINVFGEVL